MAQRVAEYQAPGTPAPRSMKLAGAQITPVERRGFRHPFLRGMRRCGSGGSSYDLCSEVF